MKSLAKFSVGTTEQCTDCGAVMFESHTETCGLCRKGFCLTCLSFHQAEHSKTATSVPIKKRNAELPDLPRWRAIYQSRHVEFSYSGKCLAGCCALTFCPPLRVPTSFVGPP